MNTYIYMPHYILTNVCIFKEWLEFFNKIQKIKKNRQWMNASYKVSMHEVNVDDDDDVDDFS